MPHDIVNPNYLFLLIVDSVIEFDQVLHISGPALVLGYSFLSVFPETLLGEFNRFVPIELSPEGLVVQLQPLHVGLVPVIYLYPVEALSVVNGVFGVVFPHDLGQVFREDGAVLQFFLLLLLSEVKGDYLGVQVVQDHLVVFELLVLRELVEIQAPIGIVQIGYSLRLLYSPDSVLVVH